MSFVRKSNIFLPNCHDIYLRVVTPLNLVFPDKLKNTSTYFCTNVQRIFSSLSIQCLLWRFFIKFQFSSGMVNSHKIVWSNRGNQDSLGRDGDSCLDASIWHLQFHCLKVRYKVYSVYSSWTKPTFWPLFFLCFFNFLPLSAILQDVSREYSDP